MPVMSIGSVSPTRDNVLIIVHSDGFAAQLAIQKVYFSNDKWVINCPCSLIFKSLQPAQF